MLVHVLAIRRSIWYVLLYCSGPAEGHMYGRGLIYLCLCDEAGWAGVRLELPLYPDHEVVGPPHCPDRVVFGRPHYAREELAPAPLRRTEVAIFVLDNSWMGV